MSKLTITNSSKAIECRTYEIAYTGSAPGETGSVTYTDCEGLLRTDYLTWEESGGIYYTINVCARDGVITTINASDNGDKGAC